MTHSIYRPRSAPPPTLPLFPYTTLFRSWELLFKRLPLKPHQETEALRIVDLIRDQLITNEVHDAERFGFLVRLERQALEQELPRSEERRVGKEWKSRWGRRPRTIDRMSHGAELSRRELCR